MTARSIPRNIAEGYGRNNTKEYYEFLGFSLASLVELLEDLFDLEQEIKGRQRNTSDDQGALREISRLIKLLMGEKTMLVNQMEEIFKMAGEQGLIPHEQIIALALEERRRREQKFDQWIQEQLRKAKGNKDSKG